MRVLRLVVILGALLTASVVSAWAYSRDFYIVNGTALPIIGVYISRPGLDRWVPTSDFRLLGSGQEAHISFGNAGPCLMQLRVNFYNGTHASWRRGFNFCSVERVTIRWDGRGYVADYTYAR